MSTADPPADPHAWQRARQPEQKASRRDAILEAAAARFDAAGYEGVVLNALAADVGLAKSNLYRYFESKEAICLQLLQDAHDVFLRDAVAALDALPAPSTPEAVGRALAAQLSAHPRLCALASIVASVLERNVEPERIAQHKGWYLQGGVHLLTALGRALPTLDPLRGFEFLRLAYALLTGLWPSAHPPAAVAQVMDTHPELALLRVDFAADLEVGLVALLRGLSPPGRSP